MAKDRSERVLQVLDGLVHGQGRGGEVDWGEEGGGWESDGALRQGSVLSVW